MFKRKKRICQFQKKMSDSSERQVLQLLWQEIIDVDTTMNKVLPQKQLPTFVFFFLCSRIFCPWSKSWWVMTVIRKLFHVTPKDSLHFQIKEVSSSPFYIICDKVRVSFSPIFSPRIFCPWSESCSVETVIRNTVPHHNKDSLHFQNTRNFQSVPPSTSSVSTSDFRFPPFFLVPEYSVRGQSLVQSKQL